MKLYEIKAEVEQALANAIDPETGEISDLEGLDSLYMDWDEKAAQVAAYIKGQLAEAEAIKSEIQKLQTRAKVLENQATRLKDYLAHNIEPGRKITRPYAVISWRKSESVAVEDASALPQDYQRVKIEADKAKIKAALKAGTELAGAKLVQKQNLQIK